MSQNISTLTAGIYRIDSLSRKTIWPDTQNEVTALLDRKKSKNKSSHRTYFTNPDEFLDTWIEGYRTGDSRFGDSVYDAIGFEMKYVNTDPESEFFKIGEHIGINNIRERKTLNSIMLCADANEICDQYGYMSLGINDMRDQSVRVYRGKNQHGEYMPYSQLGNKDFQKPLARDKHYYCWDFPEKFPFDSANPLKSDGNIWHMIGFSPLSVYEKLEKLGFIFDNKK